MNIKKLKEIIKDMPDDAPVLRESSDHAFVECSIENGTALEEDECQWTQDFGEETTPEADYGKRIKALLIY